jgi:protein adenylyltransferase
MSQTNKVNTLDKLQFVNRFTEQLPADSETGNRVRNVSGACFSRVKPQSAPAPKLVAYSREVADLLGIDPEDCESQQFVDIFSGNEQLPGMDTFAMCYGGHQFGNWAGQLGDGRVINLGEIKNSKGEHWTLQLKGSGLTPYSRGADGLAVLRSSVREFLCSEAMHHLGVPTTRALSLLKTGQQVVRDMFYNGDAKYEPGAIVCRVAPSFIRMGSFQLFPFRGELDELKQFLDFTIRSDFPHLLTDGTDLSDQVQSFEVYGKWFAEVCRTTAELMVHWMRVGFVHGVMNTDNLSILGLTIDYGPYGWLEDFNPGWTPNTTDAQGKRYAFGKQPEIAQWNLQQLANAVYQMMKVVEPFQEGLLEYARTYNKGWQNMMAAKLGFESFNAETDEALINEVQQVLLLTETDMTLFYRHLADIKTGIDLDTIMDDQLMAPLMVAYYKPEQLNDQIKARTGEWLRAYIVRLNQDERNDSERKAAMNAVNPKYVLRNYLAQLAIDKAEEGDYSEVNELLDVLRNPYDDQPDKERFAKKRPDWARHRAGCSMLSCSS